ncbi:PPE family protein [Mycobacterium europaeum]|uniref:PPE family protein n=1 Tax=Mycobacterium europaeum TaxID=761804 RepID=A0A0U1CX95_9MYCO|nr:PPE family protein [Mycobacterium europaeum]CQD03826.1 PPE family protein [Mycobacterium europaeum]
MDFCLLPPEINSGRMYAGAGSAPLNAAAASWDAIAAQLAEAAAEVAAAISGLAAAWRGPSAAGMTAAATRYQAWLTTTAAQAETTAGQARTAALAYETAFAATVPPALVAANREYLAALVASNLLGQNTAVIMALEAAYADMWAQDVAAMAEYQAASAAVTAGLPQFDSAPPVTNPGQPTGGSLQGIWSYLLGGQTVPQLFWALVQSNVSSGPWQEVTDLLALFTVFWGISTATGPDSPLGGALTKISNHIDMPPAPLAGAPKITAATGVGANELGRLSAPSWAQPPCSPQRRPPATRPLAAAHTEAPLPLPAPIPVTGGTPPKQQRPQPEYGAVVRFVPRPPSGG